MFLSYHGIVHKLGLDKIFLLKIKHIVKTCPVQIPNQINESDYVTPNDNI